MRRCESDAMPVEHAERTEKKNLPQKKNIIFFNVKIVRKYRAQWLARKYVNKKFEKKV